VTSGSLRPRHTYQWAVVVVSVAAVLLLAGGSALTYGIDQVQAASSGKDPQPGPGITAVAPAGPVHMAGSDTELSVPQGLSCLLSFLGGGLQIVVFGPGCLYGSGSHGNPNLASEAVAADNLMTTLDNYLNITNAAAANDNATFQELLSYYEDRAEALVPSFLNGTWNQTVADEIAVDSGLVPSIEGLNAAIAEQEYQDWNATAEGWDISFGSGGAYASDSAEFEIATPYGATATIAPNGFDLHVTQPWEVWKDTGAAPNALYFNMESGGTIVTTNLTNASDEGAEGNFVVDDLTNPAHSFDVPQVTYRQWIENAVPLESELNDVSPFDLLKLVCNSDCGNAVSSYVETSGAFGFANVTTATCGDLVACGGATPDLMAPFLKIGNLSNINPFFAPSSDGVCIGLTAGPSVPCSTEVTPSGGNSQSFGTGTSAVVAGNRTLYSLGPTFQHIVNNTLTMAYDYWLTLRATTDDGKYAIPATCVIPPPSDAFPTATDFTNFQLDPNDVEGVYLSYLNGVAGENGGTFTDSADFCGDSNLGFTFNWTGAWHLVLNISASVYLADASGPVNLAGQPDLNETYGNPATWPVYDIDPTLLYPYEYTDYVTVGDVYPIPINNPIIGVLVDYSGNLYYNDSTAGLKPAWGVPTYLSLTGTGNYVYTSGVSSSTSSGSPVADGDAIYISYCDWKGTVLTTGEGCPITTTYFDNFSFGLVHAILPPPPSGGGGAGSSGVNGGFCNSLFGWIPFIGSDITDLCNFVLGALEIVLIVLLLVVAIWFVAKSYGNRRSGGGRTTINVH
jgi:hypothetical protein